MYNFFVQDPVQIRYVNKKLTNHNVLLGAAGTGKTSIALAKLRKLAVEGSSGNSLFVSFANTLVNSCKEDSIGQEAQESHLFSSSVDFFTFHKLFSGLFRKAYGRYPKIAKDGTPLFFIKAIVNDLAAAQPSPVYSREPQVFLDEVSYLQDFDIPTLEAYEQASRIGCKVRVIRREDRKYYWTVYSMYKDMLARRGYDCDFSGAAAVLQKIVQQYFPQGLYDTIVIDEGQDLSPAAVKTIVSMLRENGVLLYVGDATQQIYGTRMSWKSLGLHIRNKVTRLENSYRNTVEIGDFAKDLLNSSYWDKNTTDVMYPQNMTRHGGKPVLVRCTQRSSQYDMVRRFLDQHHDETTCIVTYKNTAVNDMLYQLKRDGIDARSAREYRSSAGSKVFVCTYHSIKGLEFDNVIIVDFDAQFMDNIPVFPDMDDTVRYGQAMRLFYVACTRARQRLIISYCGTVSELFPQESKNYDSGEASFVLSLHSETHREESGSVGSTADTLSQCQIVDKEQLMQYLQKALKETKRELDIQSPWLTDRVVNDLFIDKMERLLARQVTIKILYGIQDDVQLADKNRKTKGVVEKLQRVFKRYPNFKIKKGNSHAKKMLSDDAYCISGSFNWLSYTGEGDRQEEGVVMTDTNIIETIREEEFNF